MRWQFPVNEYFEVVARRSILINQTWKLWFVEMISFQRVWDLNSIRTHVATLPRFWEICATHKTSGWRRRVGNICRCDGFKTIRAGIHPPADPDRQMYALPPMKWKWPPRRTELSSLARVTNDSTNSPSGKYSRFSLSLYRITRFPRNYTVSTVIRKYYK